MAPIGHGRGGPEQMDVWRAIDHNEGMEEAISSISSIQEEYRESGEIQGNHPGIFQTFRLGLRVFLSVS